jgi:undecaprenyl-diphosphatase
MMQLLKAALLGIVQGLTEFLPVSSSGHLLLVEKALHWDLLADPHVGKTFDVALHAGTFLALVIYFRKDVLRLLAAFGASLRYGVKGKEERRLAWFIVIGTVPAAVAGVKWEKVIEEGLGGVTLIAVQLIVFAIVLYLADRLGRKVRRLREANLGDGILVGLAQALALAPGVSRSGITISTGLARGLTRDSAARFSFLLSIPIVGGTAAYSLLKLAKDHAALGGDMPQLFVVGLLAAAISGYLCIRYFLGYLERRSLTPFVIYRIALGVALLAFFRGG